MGLYDTTIFSTTYDFPVWRMNNSIHEVLIPYIKARSPPWILKVVEGEDATRANLEDALNKTDPSIVFLASHGNETIIFDQKEKNAVDYDNAHLFKGRIVYNLACLTGVDLAPKMVEKGAKAVLAYADKVLFVSVGGRMSEPFEDTLLYPKRLCDHVTVGQVYDEMLACFDKWIMCFVVWDPAIYDFLLHDKLALVLVGDRTAKVPSVAELVASFSVSTSTALLIALTFQICLLTILKALTQKIRG